MLVPTALLQFDRDRQFDDWSQTVTFREVSQTYNTQTQQVVEAYTDTVLTAIVGENPAKPTPGTAIHDLNETIRFYIKAEDLPTAAPTTTSRMIYNSVEYDVLQFTLSPNGLVRTLDCRKTS